MQISRQGWRSKSTPDSDSNRNRRAERGKAGEAVARAHLQEKGVTLVASNWKCRSGEIDIIGLEGDTLIFVEVKSGLRTRFAGISLAERVRHHQRLRIQRAVRYYLHCQRFHLRRWGAASFRIDLITVQFLNPTHERYTIEHYPNAFELTDGNLYGGVRGEDL